jgi:hypothetical protein
MPCFFSSARWFIKPPQYGEFPYCFSSFNDWKVIGVHSVCYEFLKVSFNAWGIFFSKHISDWWPKQPWTGIVKTKGSFGKGIPQYLRMKNMLVCSKLHLLCVAREEKLIRSIKRREHGTLMVQFQECHSCGRYLRQFSICLDLSFLSCKTQAGQLSCCCWAFSPACPHLSLSCPDCH